MIDGPVMNDLFNQTLLVKGLPVQINSRREQ
jgi:hypothetical protein